jgi:anti-sigma B factor antagonist
MAYYTVYEKQDVLIVELSERRATLEISREFKESFLRLIASGKSKKLVLDFSHVDFIDSSFLGAIVSGLKKITALKGDIKIVRLQPSVRAIFELTRLYKVFEIFDDLQDAINSYSIT